jgi:hypothetical protein
MSGKKKASVNKNLTKVYDSFSGMGQELQFLNAVLSFLNKKSSYLAIPGVSKQVLQIVHNHIDIAKKIEIREQNLNKKKNKNKNANNKKKAVNKAKEMTESQSPESASSANSNTKKEADIDINISNNNDNDNDTSNTDDNKETDSQIASVAKDSDNNSNNDKASVEMNVEERVEIDENTVAPLGNGGTTGKYVWTQTLATVDILIDIDCNLRGKQLNISIKKKKLFVAVRGQESNAIIDGALHEPVDVEDSSWMLDKEYGKTTKTLCITLQKKSGMNWWSRVIVGDPEIDTKLIEPENSKLQDLDSDTRKTVEQMMFDQRQKMKGLPTSKELQQSDILERFKAQHPEMDFSNCKMGGAGFGGGGFPGGGFPGQ